MISFTGGTTINSMLKMTQMTMKWEERKSNIGKEENNMKAEPPEIKRMKELVENSKKANYISGIQIKLKSGGTLTKAELDYLKANNPEMYKDAVEIAEERERYKKELESCRTKEEADRLNFNKIGGFLSQARAMSSGGGKASTVQASDKIMAKIMGIKVDFDKYVKSGAYDSLPSEEDDGSKKKAKRKVFVDKADFANAIMEIKAEISRLDYAGQGEKDVFAGEVKAKAADALDSTAAAVKSVDVKAATATPKFTAKV